jgi:hypothetical protein
MYISDYSIALDPPTACPIQVDMCDKDVGLTHCIVGVMASIQKSISSLITLGTSPSQEPSES